MSARAFKSGLFVAAVLVTPSARATPRSPMVATAADPGAAAVRTNLVATSGRASGGRTSGASSLTVTSARPIVALPTRQAPMPGTEDKATDAHDAVRVGALAGIGFPRPLAFEGMVKLHDWVGLGGEYAMMPKMTFGDVDARLSSYALDARVFPFRGAFFVGLRGGHQRFDATATVTIPTVSSQQVTSIQTWFLNPRIGLLLTTMMGFTVGTEIGVQVPVSRKLTTDAPPEVAAQLAKDSTIKLFGGTLPTVDLLRVGGLF